MLLYVDEYQTLKYNNNDSLFEVNFTDATSKLAYRNYKNKMQNVVHFIERSKPVNLLANLENMTYMDSVSYAPPFNKMFLYTKLAAMGVRKMALIRSQDQLTQLLIERTMDQDEGDSVTTRYFNDAEQAKAWLVQGEA